MKEKGRVVLADWWTGACRQTLRSISRLTLIGKRDIRTNEGVELDGVVVCLDLLISNWGLLSNPQCR